MKMPRPRSLDLSPPRRRLKTPPAVALWRPEIVLATSVTAPPARRSVVLAEPTARPEALHTQLGTARSLLAALSDAQQVLGAAAVDAYDRAGRATSARERVSATIAAYRAEAKLDDVLAGTWRQVSALMEERGLR
jgi:uncharacterized protein (DUF2252 family)